MKRLVVCCDGTWNTPDQAVQGTACPTNVTKLALAVAKQDEEGISQLLYYHRGVGTRRSERFRGGAVGFGLSRGVCDAYRFVVEKFEPGDELFFFGFSRGAFTARSAVGLVRNVGILRREYVARLEEAYALYRDRATGPNDTEAQLFRRTFSHETRIRFIGVWDTVGALGIPDSGIPLLGRLNKRWSFHDTRLSRTVDGAFQALSIDEKRRPFEPALWEQHPKAGKQVVEQVWFPGVHCDVGGGYTDSALADVTLLWMADRARAFGLSLTPSAFEAKGGWGVPGSGLPAVRPAPLGPLHESRTRMYRMLRPYRRPIGVKDPEHEYVASTAMDRRCQQSTYRSPTLERYLAAEPRTMQVRV